VIYSWYLYFLFCLNKGRGGPRGGGGRGKSGKYCLLRHNEKKIMTCK